MGIHTFQYINSKVLFIHLIPHFWFHCLPCFPYWGFIQIHIYYTWWLFDME